MKIILNEDGPAKSPKKGKPEKKERQRPSRSGGFKRKQANRAQDIDELLASGADGTEDAAVQEAAEPEAPETAPEMEQEPTSAPSPRSVNTPHKKSGVVLARGKKVPAPPAVEEEPEPEPAAQSQEEESAQEGPVEEQQEAPAATEAEDAEEGTFSGGKKFGRPAKPTGKSPAKKMTKITVGDPEPKRRGKTPKPPKEPKAPKQTKEKKDKVPAWQAAQSRATKAQKSSKSMQKQQQVEEEDEYLTSLKPRKPEVIVMPESMGSQLLTLIEVIAGGAITFFGATQVGNILITRMMSGMLGG